MPGKGQIYKKPMKKAKFARLGKPDYNNVEDLRNPRRVPLTRQQRGQIKMQEAIDDYTKKLESMDKRTPLQKEKDQRSKSLQNVNRDRQGKETLDPKFRKEMSQTLQRGGLLPSKRIAKKPRKMGSLNKIKKGKK